MAERTLTAIVSRYSVRTRKSGAPLPGVGQHNMADIKVKVFDHDGKHWAYIDDLRRELGTINYRYLEDVISYRKCRQEIIGGRLAVEVEYLCELNYQRTRAYQAVTAGRIRAGARQ